jgi:Ni/Co efflux regulator RcnB
MKYAVAMIAVALLAARPAAAQPHPQQQSHPASQPNRPATHAPAMHPAARTPTMHTARPATHPHTASRHVTTHHVVHRHVTTHHVVHRHVTTHREVGRRAPRAVVARLRRNVVAVHRFHAGPYRAPPGWRYRRWVFGERLPGIYFAPSFWITDFLAFSLFPPPDGYVWVRYGPDALLIDQYTGEIIQVDYGVFY